MTLPYLRSLSLSELQEICLQLNLPRFRAAQVFDWVQAKGVGAWGEMTNVPGEVKERLSQVVAFEPIRVLREQVSQLDGTRKYLFQLGDGQTVESVLMPYKRAVSRDRVTVCASSQVGCAMQCAFCATGLGGLIRNLAPGEIAGQILDIRRLMSKADPEFRVSNVVFMGMGEPLQNYTNLLGAIELLNSPRGQNIGLRRMTVSTCGVVPRIIDLGRDNPQITLAISLHAARDEVRNRLVPINRKYPLQELMEACRKYIEITNRRITFEYALIEGVNSSVRDAEDLSRLVRGLLCNINIIPVNPVLETGLNRPSPAKVKEFVTVLREAGLEISLREERGTDIDAACGQLRKRQGGEGHEYYEQV
ncbi:MAG TPA: 23S rRNA (adenine(2503)-C(2))-methyltransferase RlmN [Desulfobacteria bacterium]|nr:23S rRNA (adenine(2503)-C(2))-methyltransferase RlmN [Desulfobacteria bacterium]